MKKFLTILVVLAAVSGAVNANVIDNPKPNSGLALMKSEKGFKVFYKGVKSGNVKVSITDAKGQSVFKETLKNVESFVRPYDLSSITEGEYKVEIKSAEGTQVEKFSYSKPKEGKMMNLTRVKESDEKYVLSVVNRKESADINVQIYDQNYKLVYSASEKIHGNFAKVYDLASLGDSFTFEVSDANGSTHVLKPAN